MIRLERRDPAELGPRPRLGVDAETLVKAGAIVDEVAAGGDAPLRRYATMLDGLPEGAALMIERDELERAVEEIAPATRRLLERTAARIARFANAQREALSTVSVVIDGGRAGVDIAAVERAGCYAPAGRYPLPSSVLMTTVTARIAGVEHIVVATPKPSQLMLAAAAIGGAQRLLRVGGAQAIAALAFGSESVEPVDVIVGPGNRWVTAAKQLVAGQVGIDMLAGPSELVVLADDSADPGCVAADLLAQAEHDVDAVPTLVTIAPALVDAVEVELERQLADLPTAAVAARALQRGCAVVCESLDQAIAACDALAPEHLQLCIDEAEGVLARLRHYGAAFVGEGSAEVLGDYGAGPNHVLPTSGGARFGGGLSVMTFLRLRTWMTLDQPGKELCRDAAALARLEGLEGHARAAERRL